MFARPAGGDPLERVLEWYEDARARGVPLPDAICLATATPDGSPSARMLLFKGVADGRIRFATSYDSRKADELDANPNGALVWFWPGLGRQVRIEGAVERLDADASDTLHDARPRGSQISAWTSRQSHPIEGPDTLAERRADTERRFAAEDHIPRPEHWGGYALQPSRIELWHDRPNRLHHRELFERRPDGSWTVRWIQP